MKFPVKLFRFSWLNPWYATAFTFTVFCILTADFSSLKRKPRKTSNGKKKKLSGQSCCGIMELKGYGEPNRTINKDYISAEFNMPLNL